MPTSTKRKRLDKIELQLTPKEWAIRLTDEMRQHASQADFLKAIGKGTYRELPYVKPFYALAEQAEECHARAKPEDIRAQHQLNRKLRTEFHALKVLVANVNGTIESKAETNGLKAALKLSTLRALILRDAFARTCRKASTWIKETQAAACDGHGVRQLWLRELSAYTSLDAAEPPAHSSPIAVGLGLPFPKLIETWADNSAMLLTEVDSHKAAVQTIQDRYFDGHLILFRDVEAKLTRTCQTMRAAVAISNEYLDERAHVRAEEAPPEHQNSPSLATSGHEAHLAIDIEAIQNGVGMVAGGVADARVRDAKDKAVADILEEAGEHQDMVWQRLREKAGLQSRERKG
jgi:hypothetical protein